MATGKKAMTKAALVSHLADKVGLTRKQAAAALGALTETAHKEARRGFTLPGIGKLMLRRRKARMGRNPATGEQIHIPAKTVLRFRVAKACKDNVVGMK